ncbi:hypothetical protein HK105_209068 [Polyrhizophydium stewartii]|uniref:DinB-like domain-containing protein n=1 Tax=Polyrhizophydium stewartii TaxID=2732419 RepID=A0ABR4MW21_9FUNG
MSPSHAADDALAPLVRCVAATIDDFNALLAELSPAQFTAESTVLPHSTIGKHTRHAIDHFRLLLAAIDTGLAPADQHVAGAADEARRPRPSQQSKLSSSAAGSADAEAALVDYDARERLAELETVPAAAVAALEAARAGLCAALVTRNPATPVRVAAVAVANGPPVVMLSTLAREVWFTLHHAIHHGALIRAICIEHGVPAAAIPATLGMAPSTLQHLSQAAS